MEHPAARQEETLVSRLIDRFGQAPESAQLLAHLEGGEKGAVWIRGISGSARALLAATLCSRTGRPALMVAPDHSTAEELRDDLEYFLGKRSAILMPEPGLHPYRPQHPHVAVRAARIEALAALCMPEHRAALHSCSDLRVVVTTAVGISCAVPHPDRIRSQCVLLRLGEEADLEELAGRLAAAGYSGVPMVGEYGDFSRRGGIIDIFTFGREHPVRMEFDGDEIVSIREFDPFTQRSLQAFPELLVLPMWEWMAGPAERERLRGAVAAGREGLWADPAEDLEARIYSLETDGTLEGIEWSLPLFGDWKASLFDYLPENAVLMIDGPTFVRTRMRAWADDLAAAWEDLRSGGAEHFGPGERPFLPACPPAELFNIWDDWTDSGWRGARLYMGSGGSAAGRASMDPPESEAAGSRKGGAGDCAPPPLSLRIEFGTHPPESHGRDLDRTRKYLFRLSETVPELYILCDTENHRERLADLLARAPAQFHVGNLGAGFVVPSLGLGVLTDHEIFSRLRRRPAGRRYSRGISLKELMALVPGDFVVHIDHGIGLYRGLERLVVNGQQTDCLALEYAGGDRHFVPVDQLSLVQKYSAEEGHRPQLSRLGGKSWERSKERIKKSIRDMAGELLRIYAQRKSRRGHAFSPDTPWQRELELSFPYEETTDQLQAIEDVKRDMERESPMDRLICGDVGYGKTEVAIRAAFKTVQDGRQVALLVPTTLLARQHYDTFSERLKDYPVKVDFLSRYRTTTEAKAVKKACAEGKVDILIGTHALLAKDIKFRNLGLVIVDEEQLFGVAAKEKMKRFRATVDVLTLTATPIPRTMHMALMGGRDMSTILTPPRDRRPIQTEILELRDDVIAHALMREADRGGQSFFVHNRVETIDTMARYLGQLVPHLRLAVAHGQMRERALEAVMQKFLDREYDVLVSTMIIESGLDLPNVNTILINRGDTFGLAQLYQLRGRVGRSARKAYAYLLVPPYHSITEQAQKRLKAMEEFEDLGSGYQLAMRDLEIRGAGNLLGAEQHGFIVAVGFDLYCRLLDETVAELRGEKREEAVEPRMSTDIEAFLPDRYVPDSREKMNLYKTLADASTLEAVEEVAAELADRFGRHPDPVRHLLGLRRARILGAGVRCEKITVRREMIQVEMGRDLRREEIQALMRTVPFPVEFMMHGRHRILVKEAAEPVSAALILLRSLTEAK